MLFFFIFNRSLKTCFWVSFCSCYEIIFYHIWLKAVFMESLLYVNWLWNGIQCADCVPLKIYGITESYFNKNLIRIYARIKVIKGQLFNVPYSISKKTKTWQTLASFSRCCWRNTEKNKDKNSLFACFNAVIEVITERIQVHVLVSEVSDNGN